MRMLTVMAALITAFGLSACHTIQGVGQDITAVGKGMQDATH